MSYKFNPFTGNFDDIGTPGSGSGDMLKSVYDTDNNGIVDNAERMTTIARNSTGSTIYAGTVVYLSGATGNRPNCVKALATSDATSAQTFGVAYEDIANNSDGQILSLGLMDTLDTRTTATHPFTSDTLSAGDILYLSPTTAGYVTNVKPYAPQHIVYIGMVTRTHPTQGAIVYRIQNGYELDELHNVSARYPSNGDTIKYNSTTHLWENGPSTTSLSLTEYDDSDKPSPSAGDVWVKHTTTGGGKPVGLLLALTEPGGGTEKWELSYQSVTSGIKRVEIT